MLRLVQTTIASETTDNAITAIFFRDFKVIPEGYRIKLVGIPLLGIRNIVELPYFEIPSLQTATGESTSTGGFFYISEKWLARLFEGDYETIDYDLIQSVLQEDVIVLEQSPPSLKSLFSILKEASGVTIGAYIGMATAAAMGNPMLMFVTVPAGMLILGTTKAVASALEQGLYDRVLAALKHGDKNGGA
jgi:hypothetical protein